jgi:Cytochrome P460
LNFGFFSEFPSTSFVTATAGFGWLTGGVSVRERRIVEDNMTIRRSTAGAVLIATLASTAFVAKVRAKVDDVAFPDNYAKGVQWLVVDKVENKLVVVLYAMPEAIEAARNGQPMPNGTVFTVLKYAARRDAQGNLIKASDGRLVQGELVGFNVMEKRTGWGGEYPDTLRNGEWEYRAFAADKTPDKNINLTACFECHKSMAGHDFVHAYDKLKEAAR